MGQHDAVRYAKQGYFLCVVLLAPWWQVLALMGSPLSGAEIKLQFTEIVKTESKLEAAEAHDDTTISRAQFEGRFTSPTDTTNIAKSSSCLLSTEFHFLCPCDTDTGSELWWFIFC